VENLQDYFRIKQAAEFIGVSESTLRNWGRAGKIVTYRHPLNRYRLYKRGDLETLLKEIKRSGDNETLKRSFRNERP
jgi:MerR family copper efflux transcriptional regulator